MTRRRWFFLAVCAQALVLLAMVGVYQYTLATGTRVRVATEPIDPWDPFRGEYVQLRYRINTLDLAALGVSERKFVRGQTVWVVLTPGEPYWQPVTVATARPRPSAGQVAVRARVEWFEDWTGVPRLHLRYGTESFFVPEGEAQAFQGPDVLLEVEWAVDRFGRAAVARLFRNGREVRVE
ncbi:MAG: GDYXXLXY domain-containing protein [Bacillota bacterium]|nr:MAG: hypothetical protein DIU70_12110 [Bacillota bacterium]